MAAKFTILDGRGNNLASEWIEGGGLDDIDDLFKVNLFSENDICVKYHSIEPINPTEFLDLITINSKNEPLVFPKYAKTVYFFRVLNQ